MRSSMNDQHERDMQVVARDIVAKKQGVAKYGYVPCPGCNGETNPADMQDKLCYWCSIKEVKHSGNQ